MYQTLFRHPIAWAIAAIAALLLSSSTIFVVPETQQAIVVRLGKPNRIINAYDERQPFGMTGAGLVARIPFIETRSEEHTSELQSLMRNSYAVFCLKKKKNDRHK